MNKKIVLIVGSFVNSKCGASGGIAFASSSLINSELSHEVEWIKIDSTAKLPVEHIAIRSFKALKRILKVSFNLATQKRITSLLLFVSDGASFIEKGTMVFLGKFFSKKVILAPRSGYLPAQLKHKLFRKFVMRVLNKSDYVVCQSSSWKLFFETLCDKKDNKFIVIPNWIDISNYEPNYRSILKNNDEINLLFLGWLTKEKGIFDLIEAIDLIKVKIPSIKVVFGGDGKDRNSAELQVQNRGLEHLFEFRGWVKKEEKLNLLWKSDIFILPSHAEGFPNSVLEAMACKLPVIITNIKSAEEIVDDQSGVIVEMNNPQQLSDAILKFYNDSELRRKTGEAAQKRVQNNFSIQKATEAFKKIIV